ncbi:MAG TPA: ABC transporter permease [Bryobacteraceae bacterium]|jgi:ABC-type dipeptide/oligopeptide/nickel transport system permease component
MRPLAKGSLRIIATLLIAGFCGVLLVRYSPGFGTDERELNAHLSGESISALRVAADTNPARMYWSWLRAAAHGNFGESESLNTPVATLLSDRFPLTLRSSLAGLLTAWVAALLLATISRGFGRRVADWTGTALTEVLLASPAGLIAVLLFLFLDGSSLAAAAPAIGIALAVFPHLYRNQRQLLGEAAGRPHVLSAHARGIRPLRVFLREILPGAMPPLVALAGTSVTLALGAAIPIETICDSPGIGQLAWKAATSRDLELLLPLILAVTAVTLIANFAADLVIGDRKVAA